MTGRPTLWEKTHVFHFCRDHSHRMCDKAGCACACHAVVAGYRKVTRYWKPLREIKWDDWP